MDTLLCKDDGAIVFGTNEPSNALLRLSADQYTAGSATWTDQSGNGLNFTVSTNASLKGTDADGFPYMDFNGTYGSATRGSNIPAPTSGTYTVFCVTQIRPGTGYRSLMFGSGDIQLIVLNGNLGLYNSSFVDSGFDVTGDMTSSRNLLVVELSQTAEMFKFQLNESGTDSIIKSSANFAIPFNTIGTNGTNYWGNVYEFIVYDGDLGASARAFVAEYLAYKWAITEKLPSLMTTQGLIRNEETLAFLYAGSGTETTYTWDAEGVTYADVLIVGGGGGGSCSGSAGGGGGGGGGGVIIDTVSLGAHSYTITVGAGGNGAIGTHAAGSHGKNSSAFGLTAIGGGAGNTGAGGADINGGSGGGSGASSEGVPPFGTGVSGQGNSGGTGVSSGTRAGGGGGGAGGVGGNGSSGSGGIGGVGIESRISGIPTYYAGGGAGATTNSTTISAGGNGGGGATFANGTDGLGGGGGAGYDTSRASGAGGSGIVLVKPNPGALDGLGTTIYTQAVGAYALRRLFGAYTGAQVRLRRSTNDEETDVTFDKYGHLVDFDLTTWIGAATAYVTTWYDQSGEDNDLTQTNVTYQPKYDSRNKRVNLNNAYMTIPGSDNVAPFSTNQPTLVQRTSMVSFKAPSNLASNQAKNVYAKGLATSTSRSDTRVWWYQAVNRLGSQHGKLLTTDPVGAYTSEEVVVYSIVEENSSSSVNATSHVLRQNGVRQSDSVVSSSRTFDTDPNTYPWGIGYGNGGSSRWNVDAYINEHIIFNTTLNDSVRVAVENEMQYHAIKNGPGVIPPLPLALQ